MLTKRGLGAAVAIVTIIVAIVVGLALLMFLGPLKGTVFSMKGGIAHQ